MNNDSWDDIIAENVGMRKYIMDIFTAILYVVLVSLYMCFLLVTMYATDGRKRYYKGLCKGLHSILIEYATDSNNLEEDTTLNIITLVKRFYLAYVKEYPSAVKYYGLV